MGRKLQRGEWEFNTSIGQPNKDTTLRIFLHVTKNDTGTLLQSIGLQRDVHRLTGKGKYNKSV